MSRRIKDIAGQKFGRLTAVSFSHAGAKGVACWLCRCACGGEKIVRGDKLRSGRAKSCGCYHAEIVERRADGFERRKKAGYALPPLPPRRTMRLDGFAPDEAASIEAFIAAGKVTVIRQGEWPELLAPRRPRGGMGFLDFRRGA